MDGMIAVRTRSRNGCWTCRARKVKCDEIRPKCSNCISRNIHCDYAPRPKSQRRRRTLQPEVEITASSSNTPQTSPLPPPTPRESIASSAISPGSSRPTPRLPAGLEAEKWPIPLSRVDCQAIRHYVEVIVPRTVLKTPQFSTYTSLLLLCTKHPLLAHLVLAFSVQDLAGSDKELNIIAIDHYQEALAMFIIHLGSSEQHLWVTFPALFLFIIYEQQYGDDPRAVQRHLEGVRDIVASHGSLILPAATGSSTTVNVEGEEYPRQLLDRLTLWTIYHDASASTFGYGGSLITLLDVQYPGSIARLRDSSESLTEVLWRADYPAEEELWDRQILPLEYLSHQYLLLRHRLSTCDVTHESLTNESLIFIGRELKRLEKEYYPYLEAALSGKVESSTIHSTSCCMTAMFYALVLCWERRVFEVRPSIPIFKVLKACASVYEYEGIGFLGRLAWPMFVAGLETDDLIHQSWVLDRFASLQGRGENMRRAKLLLESVFLEQRRTGRRVDYLARMRNGEFKAFVI